MLSKEEKLSYGQMLRQQMKEKQERKRREEMERRGGAHRSITEKENFHSGQKEELQRMFENDYGPFGRAGGGAPLRRYDDRRQNERLEYSRPQQFGNYYQPPPRQRVRTYEREGDPTHKGEYPPNTNLPYRQNATTEHYLPHRQYQPPSTQQYEQYVPPEYYPPSRIPQSTHQQYQYPHSIHQEPYRQQTHMYNHKSNRKIQQQPQRTQRFYENEDLADIHKKGGRNLLQLENQTDQQQLVKQKQMQQMQRQLKIQIQETQKRKKQEKERRQRQEREEDLKNQQYLERQRQKMLEQQKKKSDKQREVMEQNAINLQERKKLEEQARRKTGKQAGFNQLKRQRDPSAKSKKIRVPEDTSSHTSSQKFLEKAFKTNVSREFFHNERRREKQKQERERNIEAVTQQIKKIKNQIDQQNDFFKQEINKVRQESEMAQHDKRRAQLQIQNLKEQLRQKIEDDNQRLFQALQRQEKIMENEPYQSPQRNIPHRYPQERKTFEVPEEKRRVEPKYNRHILQNHVIEGDGSLHGDSKRIPMHIDNPKLSMSKLSDYARQTQYFKHDRMKSAYPVQKIQEYQKNEQKNKEQLDKLLLGQRKSGERWGQMSSVNSDITKQIQQLLQKKQSLGLDRPYSHLSKVGSRTLNQRESINNGTLKQSDIDRINNRNEARLNQFRKLGVQTINTTNSEDFSKLDQILNKYKKHRTS